MDRTRDCRRNGNLRVETAFFSKASYFVVLAQLAQFEVKSASRFVAAVVPDQGLEWLWKAILPCSDDLGCFPEATSRICFGACICATRFAGRTGRFTAIGAWFAACGLAVGLFSRRSPIWENWTSAAALKHGHCRGI